LTDTAATWEWANGLAVPGRFEDPISLALTKLMSDLKPGEKLPNERDIAAELGVSRNALRDRLQLMEALGLISRRQGSGSYVEETFNPDGLIFALEMLVTVGQLKLRELHEVRVGLERQAAILSAEGAATDESITEMREAINGISTHFGTPEGVEEDIRFHKLLMLSAQNPALAFFADALHSTLARAAKLGNSNWQTHSFGRKLLVAAHEDIVDAIAARDPQAASLAVDAHFRLVAQVVSRSY
jgi:GntR family transcriptional repressor for pyruvate dehydrogenase complex